MTSEEPNNPDATELVVLDQIGSRSEPTVVEATSVSAKWSLRLFYCSHFLFTWNDRVWEFASVILLVAAFPDTLMPSSVFGLVTTASAIVFSPTVGRWFDSTARLKSVRLAIAAQRVTVAVGCFCLWIMTSENPETRLKDGLFALVIFLGCIAKLAFVGKTVSIERDWVCRDGIRQLRLGNCYRSIAGYGPERYILYLSKLTTVINAVMRRIDLFCKLAGPLFVSLLTIRSSAFTAIFLACSNLGSFPFEYFFILVVHRRFPALAVKPPRSSTIPIPLIRSISEWPGRTFSSWKIYYGSPLFTASLALCILYFTVLSFGG